ncbi:hypothetical protein R0J87_09325 [Halomonas sp. SIMBA_159]
MKWFIGYKTDGEILGTVTASTPEIARYMFEQVLEVEGPVPEELFFVRFEDSIPVILEKGVLETPYQVSGLSLSIDPLPIGTIIEVGGYSLQTDSEPTQIDFDEPGEYSVEINPPPEFKRVILEVKVG